MSRVRVIRRKPSHRLAWNILLDMNKLEPQRCRSSHRCSRCNIFTCVIRTRSSARLLVCFARIYMCKNTHPHKYIHTRLTSFRAHCRAFARVAIGLPVYEHVRGCARLLLRLRSSPALWNLLAHRQGCNIVAVTTIPAGYGPPPRLIIPKILRNRYILPRFILQVLKKKCFYTLIQYLHAITLHVKYFWKRCSFI